MLGKRRRSVGDQGTDETDDDADCGSKAFGLVPLDSRDGDVVAVFLGFRVPFVLRPYGEGKWQLVGECYVPWLMEGQAVADVDRERAYEDEPLSPLEDFHIY